MAAGSADVWLGPIHPTNPYNSIGHSPVKPIKVSMTEGKQAVLFDNSYPYALQSDVVNITVDTVLYTSAQTTLLSLIHQVEELAQNAEWQRAGLFIQWREDAINDGEDGWYVIKSAEIGEDLVFSGYAEPKIDVELRKRQQANVGVFVDAKAVPNDFNLSGVALGAYVQGVGGTIYPTATFTYTAKDGTVISVVENAPQILKANLTTPNTTMIAGRCSVFDSTVNDSTAVEVFWKDHRNLNGYYKFDNGLVRYSVNLAGGDPLVEIASAGSWVTMGNYQLINGSVVVQTCSPGIISPDEVTWTEERFGSGFYLRVQNRIRRGSRLIESSIVAAGNIAFNSAGAIQITNVPTTITGMSVTADGTSCFGVGGATIIPGFSYLSKPANQANIAGNLMTANQASFETGTTGWGNTVNCSISQTAVQAFNGTKSLQLSSTAAGLMSVSTPVGTLGFPVTPGLTYTALVQYRTASVVKSDFTTINWYDTQGNLLVGNGGTANNDSAAAWTQCFVTQVAPSMATTAAVVATVQATAGAAEIHYIDGCSFAQGSSIVWALPPATYIIDSGYTIPAGTIVRLALMAGLQDNQYALYPRPSPATAFAVTNLGAAGATTYSYEVVGVSAAGTWSTVALAQTTTGNAALTSTNKNHLAWTAGANSVSYLIFKVIAGMFVQIGTTAGVVFDDTGLTASTGAVADVSNGHTYATRVSSYNRTRIKQRLLVDGS